MTAMDGDLSTPFGIVVLIMFGMVSIASLLGNGFIIAVNSHSWFQNGKLVPCDLLLTCLSIFRFLMQCATLSGQYIYISSPMDYTCTYISKGVDFVWMYFTMANFSGTTCLTVFYCVKVTTFAHPLFLWLKSRIDRLVPRMLIMSLIASFFFYFLPGLNFWRVEASCNLSRNLTASSSHTEAPEESSYVITNYPQFFFSAVNFSICLTASILLIISLWRHTRNLKRSGIHTKDISSQAHIKEQTLGIEIGWKLGVIPLVPLRRFSGKGTRMDEGNTTPFILILLLILGFECIVAFLGNGFIVVVNCQRWLQSRKMLPSDLLLTALGTARFLFQVVVITEELLYFCYSEFICNNFLWENFFSAWIYFSSASIWCATWLSVFYCVKITNFPHRLFLWLRPRIDMLVPRLIGLSLTVFSLPFAASAWGMNIHCDLTGNMTGNTSQGEDSYNYRFEILISLQVAFIAINFSICLSASILLLASLWRHTRNLKRSGIATKDFNTQAHINAVNFLLSFLFFYILYVVAVTIALRYSLSLDIVEGLVSDIVLSLCPSTHSIFLILTNPKLKEVCFSILKIGRIT
ncbi:hypothetical protein lerEdw1_009059 [Lerista edwardsae]|nr:hypothetical protein lerEdw1_009059 [Lerista edwardsae]